MKRAVAGASSLVGLVLVVCAVMGAIALGPHGTWRTSQHVPAGHGTVVVEPALASVLGPTVTIRAETADGSDVALFAGRSRPDDAQALVETTDRVLLTGLDGARRLRTEQHVGNDPLPPMDQVDLWRSSATGDGAVELSYRPTRGAESVVLGRVDGGELPALDLTVSWNDRGWFWIPSTLLLLGIGLIALARRLRRPAPAAVLPPTRPSARPPQPVPTSRMARRRELQSGRKRATSLTGRRR